MTGSVQRYNVHSSTVPVHIVSKMIHYNDVIVSTITSQITSLTIVYSIVYSSADQSKHQSSALLAFVRGIHRRPVNSPHKGPVTRKMFPFDDVIMSVFLSTLPTHVTLTLSPFSIFSVFSQLVLSRPFLLSHSLCLCRSIPSALFFQSSFSPTCYFIRWLSITSRYIHISGLVQYCSNANALSMELVQSCTKPSI